MQQAFLELKDLQKNYADKKALNHINLSIQKGTIYGLIGQNGAGKTTMIRIINKIIESDRGQILFEGRPLENKDLLKIGYLPEERGLYKNMTIEEQALYFGQLKGMTKAEANNQLNYWLDKFEIQAWKKKKLEKLSKGMAQKVQFVIAVLHQPSCIILDEPFSGLDPVNANLIAQEIKQLAKEGRTIIFSSHRMESVTEMCDRVCLIHQGNILLEGTLEDIQSGLSHEVYKVVLKDVDSVALQNLKNIYTIEASFVQENQLELEVSSHTEINTNHLLAQLSRVGDVLLFEQFKPTLQDIFIKTIQHA